MENYLTFTVASNYYAINVLSVLEVLNFTAPTAIPCALPYIEGLIFSREQGITVLNLRKRFNLEEHPVDKWTKIIVVEVPEPTEKDPNHITLYGLVADSVQDVIQIYEKELVSDGNCSIPAEFISEVLKANDENLFILNFEKIFEEHRSLADKD